MLKKNLSCLIERLVEHSFGAGRIPLFQYLDDKIHVFCMRSKFIRNLVLGALKNSGKVKHELRVAS